jgi:FkbM family methyltransferase
MPVFEAPKQRWIKATKRGQIDLDWLKIPYCELNVEGTTLRYVATNRLAEKRVETLFSKEPTTIPWLETIARDETLIDIGANVGMYSIYAAQRCGARVYSFEPESLNYAELNKNIYLNDAHKRITAYCIALSDENRVDRLLLGGFAEGLSHHDFGENTWTTDKDFGALKTSKEQRLEQGCVAFSLDSLIASGAVPMPDHIKIDVDGLEHRVVAGAWRTLTDERLKSVLIEVDHRIPACLAIVEKMTAAGWRYSMEQLRTNRKLVFTEQQIETMRRKGDGGFNYVFFRDERYAQMFRSFLEGYVVPLGKK